MAKEIKIEDIKHKRLKKLATCQDCDWYLGETEKNINLVAKDHVMTTGHTVEYEDVGIFYINKLMKNDKED